MTSNARKALDRKAATARQHAPAPGPDITGNDGSERRSSLFVFSGSVRPISIMPIDEAESLWVDLEAVALIALTQADQRLAIAA